MDDHLLLIILALLVGLLGTAIIKQAYYRHRSIKFAKWVTGNGQYMPLDESILDEAIQHARSTGTEKQFLVLLRKIRSVHGHRNVKVGHLYWIWDQVEKGVGDIETLDVPRFTKDE